MIFMGKGKSILNPIQEIEFLGFAFNLVTITVSITKRKTEAILSKIRRFFREKIPSNQEISLGYWLNHFTISGYFI